jgi:Leucine-rich repeat (LRR) protein
MENQLENIPVEIDGLINLEILYLNSNQLENIPSEIGRLCNLQKLYLGNNSLYSLPAEIGRLCNLEELYLNNNSLKSLPSEIKNLINLNELYLDESSYEINNLDPDCTILILSDIENPITNLPYGLKELYLKKTIDNSMIKIPFGCGINYDLDKILK